MGFSSKSNEVLYYQPKIKNFGDHLNALIIDTLNLTDLKYPTLGIGSILTHDFLASQNYQNQPIFTLGSGCRSGLEENVCSFVNGSFVRGPLSAHAMQDKVHFISDGAYLLRKTQLFNKLSQTTKKHEISIVPYFRSYRFIDWAKFEAETGVHVINPSVPNGLEHTLEEIAKSKYIIAEAMHGAIVADVLRIPWVKLDFLASSYEGKAVNTYKWTDWQRSLQLSDCKSLDTNTYHSLISSTRNYTIKNAYLDLFKRSNSRKLKRSITSFLQNPYYYLSDDARLASIDQELENSLQILRDDKK